MKKKNEMIKPFTIGEDKDPITQCAEFMGLSKPGDKGSVRITENNRLVSIVETDNGHLKKSATKYPTDTIVATVSKKISRL